MSNITLIQGSLNPDSKTSVLLNEVANILKDKKIDYELIDLRKIELQFCDGRDLEKYNKDLQKAYEIMGKSSGYVVGMPVYCYSVSGVLKNFLDITCGAMENKVCGIVCNAGGAMSYLASGDLMKILSYEVHVLSVQPTVYAHGNDLKDGKIVNQKVLDKANTMVERLMAHVK